jgi:hypothetical protein
MSGPPPSTVPHHEVDMSAYYIWVKLSHVYFVGCICILTLGGILVAQVL